jgi:hypothetical protein
VAPESYSWVDLSTAPETAGVYAWYAALGISQADLDEFERSVTAIKASGHSPVAFIDSKLDGLIFRPYREDDYQVSIFGPLKPEYVGSAAHKPPISTSLVMRLCEDPTRLREIAQAIRSAAPYFTAPLYIGMARNLRQRLMRHKGLIEALYDSPRDRESVALTDGDAGFAKQVFARGFDYTALFVYIQQIDIRSNEQADVENILNRINFPIFGRN